MRATRLGPVLRRLMPRFSLRTLMVFTGLVGAGYALWHNWGPWRHHNVFIIPEPGMDPDEDEAWKWIVRDIRFSPDGHRLFALVDHLGGHTKIQIQACLWELDPPILLYSKRCFFKVKSDEENDIDLFTKQARGDLPIDLSDFEKRADVWCYSPAEAWRVRQMKPGHVEVQQFRRPEAWWGVILLPELYVTALCALLLVWSAWQDLRRMAPLRPSTQG